jgi:hypothetical protein
LLSKRLFPRCHFDLISLVAHAWIGVGRAIIAGKLAVDTPIASFSQCVRDLAYVLAAAAQPQGKDQNWLRPKVAIQRKLLDQANSAHLNHP